MSTTTANKKDIPQIPVGFETIPAEDAEAREKLTTARVGLLLKASWFGSMATRLPLVNSDAWLPTAATDGRYFYYNSKFINMLKVKECEFLFGHEVLHNVYEHLGRSNDNKHNPQIANIAADYAVNSDLIHARIGTQITTVPTLYDPKYTGWAMEEIYDYIVDNAEKIDIEDLVDQLLDEHLDGEDSNGSGDGNDDGKPTEGKGGNLESKSKPKYNEEDRKKIRDEIKDALINSAKTCENAGELPGGVQRLIKDLTEPKMDWRDLIAQSIESTIKSDFSFMRQSRKGWQTNVILPGMIPENTIDVSIALDMSGSISNEMGRDMLSEVKGIMEQFTSFKIKLWCFDTDVYNYAEFDESNVDEIDEYEPTGGGGTDFMCNWRYMKDNDIQPDRFIMFTDGYPCGQWGDEQYCDTVYIIHGNDTIQPPFGTWAYYPMKK
jgi:predicted metal-dependent peptidase